MRNTLPKSSILRGFQVFRTIYETGVCYNSKLLSCYVVKGETTEKQSPVIWGFSVSKRKLSRAVDRNRVRRLMRETVRLYSHEFCDVMVSRRISAKIVLVFRYNNSVDIKKLHVKEMIESWNDAQKKIIEGIR